MSGGPRPPLPLRLLARLLPAELRDVAAGDALEEYRRLARRSRVRALIWAWQQLFTSDLLRLRREMSGHADPPPAPRRFSMNDLLTDLRYAVRTLARRPVFTGVVVATLALGIGANAAILNVVHTVVWTPLPYENPDGLVFLRERAETRTLSIALPNLLDWKAQNEVFEGLGGYAYTNVNATGSGGAERLSVALAEAETFALLAVQPALGRTFTAEEDSPGGARSVILSHELWQRRFDADPTVLGQSVTLDDEPWTVIGVMPEGFVFPPWAEIDAWFPFGRYTEEFTMNRGSHPGIYAIGRLLPGVSVERARADMAAIAERLERAYPETNEGRRVDLVPMSEQFLGGAASGLLMLLGASAFVLLIACANVASLSLSRAIDRRREIAVRQALGAGSARLVRQLITESTVLGLAGGALGLALAGWGTDLIASVGGAGLPRADTLGIDAWTAAAVAVISMLVGALVGAIPAINAVRDLRGAVVRNSARTATRGGRRLHRTLVATEFGAAVVLMVGAGLMIQGFYALIRVDPGFDPTNVVTARLSLPDTRYPDAAQIGALYRRLLAEVGTLPGVDTAAIVNPLPMGGADRQTGIDVVGRPAVAPEDRLSTDYAVVSEGYFDTLRIAVRQGRGLQAADMAEGAEPVVVIDELMRATLFPGEDPVGQYLAFWDRQWRIVGVVDDVKHYGLDRDSRIQMYVPHTGSSLSSFTLLARSELPPETILPAVRARLATIDPELPLYDVGTMRSIFNSSMAEQRADLALLGVFAGLAVVLSALGVYGVMSHTVGAQAREFGVRSALGARRAEIFRLVLAQGATVCAVGGALGLAGAWALGRLLEGVVFGIAPASAATAAAVAAFMALVALIATWLPARRATSVDPVTILREE